GMGSWATLAALGGVTVAEGNGHACRWMLLVCSIPAIALWLGTRMIPESPRWHIRRGELTEAIGGLKRIRDEDRHDVAIEAAELEEHRRLEEKSDKRSL